MNSTYICLWCNTGTEDIEAHICDQLIAARLEDGIITCRTCTDFFYNLNDYVDHRCKKHEDEPPAKKHKAEPPAKKHEDEPSAKKHEDEPSVKKRHFQRKRRNKPTEQLIASRLEEGILTCRTCYNIFQTIDDYAVHRCEPPAKKDVFKKRQLMLRNKSVEVEDRL